MKPTCRHCRSLPASRPRGLCWKCYYTPGVRAKFPSISAYGRRGVAVAADGSVEPDGEAMNTTPLPEPTRRRQDFRSDVKVPPFVGGGGPGSKPSKMDGLKGESYRHPIGYVPVYKGLTDLPAFRAGERAFVEGVQLSANPYTGRPREAESWIDGWAFESSKGWWFCLPDMPKPFGPRKTAFKRTRTGEHAA